MSRWRTPEKHTCLFEKKKVQICFSGDRTDVFRLLLRLIGVHSQATFALEYYQLEFTYMKVNNVQQQQSRQRLLALRESHHQRIHASWEAHSWNQYWEFCYWGDWGDNILTIMPPSTRDVKRLGRSFDLRWWRKRLSPNMFFHTVLLLEPPPWCHAGFCEYETVQSTKNHCQRCLGSG